MHCAKTAEIMCPATDPGLYAVQNSGATDNVGLGGQIVCPAADPGLYAVRNSGSTLTMWYWWANHVSCRRPRVICSAEHWLHSDKLFLVGRL
jgi:hypothetical protein